MKITRENYESFFIDLIDGTLANNKVDELLDFMRDNPDLAKELNGLEKIKIENDPELRYSSHSLLKTDFDQADIFEETCIRSIENDLSEPEEIKLQNYLLTNKKAEADYLLFKATISEPDSLVTYSQLNSLKRNNKILPFWYAYAAVLLIGFLLWFNFDNTQTVVNVAKVIPLYDAPQVELKMQYFEPTLAKLNEVKIDEIQKPIVTKVEIASRKIENIELLSSNPVIAFSKVQVADNLELIPSNKSNQIIYPSIVDFLALEISKIDPKDKAKQITNNTLDKIENVSNDKLSFAKNNEGRVKKIEFNSKLLAFSFPVNSK